MNLARVPWRKVLVIFAIVLLAFELVYVAAINVLLRTGKLESLANSATDDIHMKLRGGWSVWPGRVHLEHMQFRFQDRNLQFQVSLDNAVVDVALFELPGKTVHLTRVRGENTRYLFRHKVESPKGLEKRLEHYPKIEGFPDPPVFTEPKSAALSDEEYDLWTVQLEDIQVRATELWFQEYRWQGKGSATGGFRLEPQRDAQTDPCKLDLEDGTLTAGPHVVANAFRGQLHAQLDRHDPRKVEGEAIFGKISLRANLRGEIPNLNVTQLYTEGTGLEVSRGQGDLRIETNLKSGAWSEGSRIRYTTDGITIRKDELVVSGQVELEARITQGGQDSRVRFDVDVPRAVIGLKGTPPTIEAPIVRRTHASFGATADLTKPIRWTSLSGEGRAALPELRWLNHPFEKPDLFVGGAAEAELQYQWAEGKLGTGKVELDIDRLRFALFEQPTLVSGKLVAAGSYDANTKKGQLARLQLELPTVQVEKLPLPGGLHIRGERVLWHGFPPERLDARVVLESETLQTLLPLVVSSAILRTIADALVELGKTRAVLEAKRTPVAWELQLESAKSGNLEAFGELRIDEGVPNPCGRWYLEDGDMSAGIVQSGGDFSVEPLVSAAWWRERPPAVRCSKKTPDEIEEAEDKAKEKRAVRPGARSK